MKRSRQHLAAAATVGLAALAGARGALSAERGGAAYYPVSGAAVDATPLPPVVFTKVCDARVPGTALPGSLEIDERGASAVFRTTEGRFRVDLRECGVEPVSGSVPQEAPPSPLRPVPERQPAKWEVRLAERGLGGVRIDGPDHLTAILTRNGTIYGRDTRRGHQQWRAVVDHRISFGGASAGPYILVAPDTSRTLSAYRYRDGSLAGAFRLESDDAAFMSAPAVAGDHAAILAVESPRPETRLLTLRISPAGTTSASPLP